jgi:ribonuclease Z
MIDVCLLGTGGMMPLPYRALTSLMLRYNGSSLLVDCGEATQISVRRRGWSFNPIDVILITHFHADHISGLPGMLLAMGNADRKEPVTIVGPKGIEHVVRSLLVIAPRLPFEVKCIELDVNKDEEVLELIGLRVKAFKVNHNMLCYGYSFELDRAGKFDADAAKSLGLPVQLWGKLQSGETVEYEGSTFTSDMVMGPARKGLKITYTTDTRPT